VISPEELLAQAKAMQVPHQPAPVHGDSIQRSITAVFHRIAYELRFLFLPSSLVSGIFLRILKRREKIELQLLFRFLSRVVSLMTFSVSFDGESIIEFFYSIRRSVLCEPAAANACPLKPVSAQIIIGKHRVLNSQRTLSLGLSAGKPSGTSPGGRAACARSSSADHYRARRRFGRVSATRPTRAGTSGAHATLA
jgi:hypothetical protein